MPPAGEGRLILGAGRRLVTRRDQPQPVAAVRSVPAFRAQPSTLDSLAQQPIVGTGSTLVPLA